MSQFGNARFFLTIYDSSFNRDTADIPDIPDIAILVSTMAVDWFKLEVASEAAAEVHHRFNAARSGGKKVAKGDFAVVLISAGMRKCAELHKFTQPHRRPVAGTSTIQIDKDRHSSFLARLDTFTVEKGFYSRHFAARYCLYSELNMKVD